MDKYRIEARRPYGVGTYLESDQDYVLNNLDACVLLLDQQLAMHETRRGRETRRGGRGDRPNGGSR